MSIVSNAMLIAAKSPISVTKIPGCVSGFED